MDDYEPASDTLVVAETSVEKKKLDAAFGVFRANTSHLAISLTDDESFTWMP